MENQVQRRSRRASRMWRKRLHKNVALLIIIIITLLTLVNIIKTDDEMSVKENRNLAKFPIISFERIVDGRFMEDFETYQSDQFIFRNLWISLKTRLDSLAGKNYENGVYHGKGGYLIEDAATPDEENLSKNIAAINALADSKAAAVYTMIVPNAVSILSNKLPAFAPVRSQNEDLTTFRNRLSVNVHDIDVAEALTDHANEQLYYRSDHHWTTTGAYYGFLEAAKTLNIDGSSITYDVYKVSNDFVGTMASTSGYACDADTIEAYIPANSPVQYVIEYVEEQQKYPSVFRSEQLETYDKYTFFLGGNSPILRIKTTAITNRRLLLVKDSYANCLVPFLIPYYKEIVVVDPRYYYGDIFSEMANEQLTEVLFLYNANTFFTDNAISGVFTQIQEELPDDIMDESQPEI